MKIRVVPTIAFCLSDNDFSGRWFNGTAFLVDDIGHFYTAGHNFRKKERGNGDAEPEKLKCFALIDGELFPTEELFVEYDFYSEALKKDFAYGKIKKKKKIPSIKIIDSNESIALGYSIRELDFEQIETVKWEEKEFFLYKVPISIGNNSMKISPNINISFENVRFYTTESGISLEGLSGGPILQNDEILGVLVSNCFLMKEYIEKLLNIQ